MIPAGFSSTLREDLRAIDGQCLLGRGEPITTEAAAAVVGRAPQGGFPALPFKDTPGLADFRASFADPNYATLFRDVQEVAAIQDLVGGLSLPAPCLEEFRQMQRLDPYTYRHIFVVTALTSLIAKRMWVAPEKLSALAAAALLHDFGKMRIPQDILLSRERLDEESYRLIREHPLLGYLLLAHYAGDQRSFAAQVALLHHEKGRGGGYPFGRPQQDETIGLITVNDMYDALISRRTYREEAFDIRGALDLLYDEAKAGNVPEIPVLHLIALNRKIRPDDVRTMSVHQAKRGRVPQQNNYGPEKK